MSLLKFKEWDQINEASVFDKIKTWFSSNFGGKIKKIDSLLGDYKDSELRFVDEWEEIRVEIDKLELQKKQVKSDPAEYKKIERLIERNKGVSTASAKAHDKKTDELMSKVKEEIGSDQKLKNYWETGKIKVDAEVSEEMYKKAKKLADQDLADELYRKYKDSVLKAKEKDEEFRKEYGDLLGGRREGKRSVDYTPDYSESEFEVLSKLSVLDFSERVKDFPKDEAKRLVSYLLNERNDLYVQMDMERDAVNAAIAGKPSTVKVKEDAAEKLKEIREKYMPKIREMRSKITIARKYA